MTTPLLVSRTLLVKASPSRAFEVFTQKMSLWWPLKSHHIGKSDATDAVMEPFVGGRWYERGADGSECDWGHVRAWEPPGRVVLSWEIDADWKANPNVASEVEVRFVEVPEGTRVELEHRKLEAFGERAAEMRGVFGGDGGWNTLLAAFGAAF
jgi:uncharacterized protein YndB with AHSA1/START domain